MEHEPLAPKPQPVFGQGFKYNGRLVVKGIPRAEPSEIKRLIREPPGASPEQLHDWQTESLRVATKPWLDAQARHYGLILGGMDYNKDELRDLMLKESLKPDFDDARRQFRFFGGDQFEQMKADWEAQCAAYKESCFSGRRQADFDNLATLEEKLNFDVDMFLETYYSDRRTLPGPTPFRGINFEFIMDAMAKIPGLCAQKVGTDFQKMLWVGWDKKEVKQVCKEYTALAKANAAERRQVKQKAEALAHEKRLKKAQHWRLEPHRDYVGRANRGRGVEGSYIVEVAVLGGFHEESKTAREWMDIRTTILPGVYEATFNFMPALEGVMILSQVEEDVQKYLNYFEPPTTAQATATNNEDATRAGPQSGSKRKRKQTGNGGQGRANGSSSGPDPKRLRPDVPDLLEGCTRYHARWRGSVATKTFEGTGDGREPVRVRENGENKGWVDFLESDKAQFMVHCEAPLIVGVVQGYKVSDQPRFEASKWAARPKADESYLRQSYNK
ncbi:hypothetical protein GGR54DRAFT_600450 [Hypoxylon sp. NC1633]|nr:hypothetical protein GGR54DRAFT_600450 [Hypoxylon sp. NC1633]